MTLSSISKINSDVSNIVNCRDELALHLLDYENWTYTRDLDRTIDILLLVRTHTYTLIDIAIVFFSYDKSDNLRSERMV